MSAKYVPLKLGTLGGSLAAALPTLYADELVKSVLLAMLGASVSFVVSFLWKMAFKRVFKKHFKKKP